MEELREKGRAAVNLPSQSGLLGHCGIAAGSGALGKQGMGKGSLEGKNAISVSH